jgi:diguanylate cyclase (GGDEF)-like protein/PAS domain S-box-containing protein
LIVESIPFLQQPAVSAFLQAFEYASESVVITGLDVEKAEDRFLFVNQVFLQRTGYSLEELRGKTPRILQGKDTNRVVLDRLRQTLGRGQIFVGQNTNYRKDGSEYIVRWFIAPLKDESGRQVAWFSMQKEVSPLPNAQEEAMFLAAALNQTADAITITDLKGEILFVNAAFSRMTGYQMGDVRGENVRILQSGKQSRSFYADMWDVLIGGDTFRSTFINRRKDGSLYFEEKTISPVLDHLGEPQYFVSIGKNITELMEKSNAYANKAYHDALTGLYNRLKFDEVMERKFATAWPPPHPFSLVVMDLDNFKIINDEYGHAVGDEVLKQLAELMLGKLRHNDMLVRWGGEELVLLVDDDADTALRIAEKLRQAIAAHTFDPRFTVTASFGVSEVRAGDDPDSLFSRADEAVYESKHHGKNRVSKI